VPISDHQITVEYQHSFGRHRSYWLAANGIHRRNDADYARSQGKHLYLDTAINAIERMTRKRADMIDLCRFHPSCQLMCKSILISFVALRHIVPMCIVRFQISAYSYILESQRATQAKYELRNRFSKPPLASNGG
jgi:hypothetical protein